MSQSLVEENPNDESSKELAAELFPGRVTRQRSAAALKIVGGGSTPPRSPTRSSRPSSPTKKPSVVLEPKEAASEVSKDEESVAFDLAMLASTALSFTASPPKPSSLMPMAPQSGRLSSLSPQRSARSVIQHQGVFAISAPSSARTSQRTKKPSKNDTDDEYLYFEDTDTENEESPDSDDETREERKKPSPAPVPRQNARRGGKAATATSENGGNARKRKRQSMETLTSAETAAPAISNAATAATNGPLAATSPPNGQTGSSRRHPPTNFVPMPSKRQKTNEHRTVVPVATPQPPTIIPNHARHISPPQTPNSATSRGHSPSTSPTGTGGSSRAHTGLLAPADKIAQEVGARTHPPTVKRPRTAHPTTLETLLCQDRLNPKPNRRHEPDVSYLAADEMLTDDGEFGTVTTVPSPPPMVSGDVSTSVSQRFLEHLATSISSPDKANLFKRFCKCEWFYSRLEASWFTLNTFQDCVNALDLGHLPTPQTTRKVWDEIRAEIGSPRRFSKSFIMEERALLAKHRIEKRAGGQHTLAVNDRVAIWHNHTIQIGTVLDYRTVKEESKGITHPPIPEETKYLEYYVAIHSPPQIKVWVKDIALMSAAENKAVAVLPSTDAVTGLVSQPEEFDATIPEEDGDQSSSSSSTVKSNRSSDEHTTPAPSKQAPKRRGRGSAWVKPPLAVSIPNTSLLADEESLSPTFAPTSVSLGPGPLSPVQPPAPVSRNSSTNCLAPGSAITTATLVSPQVAELDIDVILQPASLFKCFRLTDVQSLALIIKYLEQKEQLLQDIDVLTTEFEDIADEVMPLGASDPPQNAGVQANDRVGLPSLAELEALHQQLNASSPAAGETTEFPVEKRKKYVELLIEMNVVNRQIQSSLQEFEKRHQEVLLSQPALRVFFQHLQARSHTNPGQSTTQVATGKTTTVSYGNWYTDLHQISKSEAEVIMQQFLAPLRHAQVATNAEVAASQSSPIEGTTAGGGIDLIQRMTAMATLLVQLKQCQEFPFAQEQIALIMDNALKPLRPTHDENIALFAQLKGLVAAMQQQFSARPCLPPAK